MSIIKTVLTGVGLAAVGYGTYKGAQYLIEHNASDDDDINAIIEKARARTEAELDGQGLTGISSAQTSAAN